MAGSFVPDAASWWGLPGRAGWIPDAWTGTAYPPALAGLAVGAWDLEENGRAPVAQPWPGVASARAPLAWYDTLAVGVGDPSPWRGFGAPLVNVRASSRRDAKPARASFSLAGGSAGLGDQALTVARGDSLHGLRVEAFDAERGALGGVERQTRHGWGLSGWTTRGAHSLEGAFAQRGEAGRLAGGEEQGPASGESGFAAWTLRHGRRQARLAWSRGHDQHESFGPLLAWSRRDAQDTRVTLEAAAPAGGGQLGLRAEWRDLEVRRAGARRFSREAKAWWGATRWAGPLGPGGLELALGGGRHGVVDRVEVTPALRYSFRAGPALAALSLERTVVPVWADLAPGEGPFTQDAWLGGLRAATAAPGAWRMRGSLLAGHARARAVVERLPFESLWLYRGLRVAPGRYDFGLAEGALSWSGRVVDAGAEGFGLASHEEVRGTPRVDPRTGFRARVGGRFTLFGGDLGVALHLEAVGIGGRQSQTPVVRDLPGYLTSGAGAVLTLGDATIGLAVRGLENQVREQTWLDSSTGALARTPGREFRMTLIWRMFN